jgi:uncharacterized protein
MKKLIHTNSDLKVALLDITQQINQSGFRPQLIIGPGRGAYIPGVMLSHYYGCSFEGFRWQTRDGVCQDNKTLEHILSKYQKHNILCVDDINDTGTTLLGIRSVLKEHIQDFEQNVKFCTIFSKNTSDFQDLDFYSIEVVADDDRWIVFPYEEWWKQP